VSHAPAQRVGPANARAKPAAVRARTERVARREESAPAAPDLDYRSATTIESLIEDAVQRAVSRALGPHLERLHLCEPMVFTVSQAAQALQVSEDTIGRLVRRGVLPRVPHLDGKVLIPRQAVVRLVADQPAAEPSAEGSPVSNRSIRSAAC
jgi:excisionase family DNA binding protein